LVRTGGQLKAALKGGRPDVLYWLSHASSEALELDGESIKPNLHPNLDGGQGAAGDQEAGLADDRDGRIGPPGPRCRVE